MKVAVIGASGRGGSRIVGELVRRGHECLAHLAMEALS